MTRFHAALVLAPRSVSVAVVDRAVPGRLPLARRELPEATGPLAILEAAWQLVCLELDRRGVEPARVSGVAITLAGAIDDEDRPVGPEWPESWRGINLSEWAAAQFPGTERGAGVDVADEMTTLAATWPGNGPTIDLLVSCDEAIAALWRGERIPLGPLTPGLLPWSIPPRGGRVCDVASGPALVARWNDVVAARQASAARFGTEPGSSGARAITALNDLFSHAVREEPTARALLSDAAGTLAWATAQMAILFPEVEGIRLAGPLAELPPDLFADLFRRQLHEWLAVARGETTRSMRPLLPVSVLPRSRELLLERSIERLEGRPEGGLRLHGASDDDS